MNTRQVSLFWRVLVWFWCRTASTSVVIPDGDSNSRAFCRWVFDRTIYSISFKDCSVTEMVIESVKASIQKIKPVPWFKGVVLQDKQLCYFDRPNTFYVTYLPEFDNFSMGSCFATSSTSTVLRLLDKGCPKSRHPYNCKEWTFHRYLYF